MDYEFEEPEESYGPPEVDNDLEIYGWSNIPYNPDVDAQTRRVFVLEPGDLGGRDFSIKECNTKLYPNRVVDAHKLESGSEEIIEKPTPKLNSTTSYLLSEIPDMVHPTEDEVRFKRAEMREFSIELIKRNQETVRLSLDREFSTYTLIKMAREIDEFSIPSNITNYLVRNNI